MLYCPIIPIEFNYNFGIFYLVYVDMGLASNAPIMLTSVTSGASFSRSFSIKVTQIDCYSLSKGKNFNTISYTFLFIKFVLQNNLSIILLIHFSCWWVFTVFYGCQRTDEVFQLQRRCWFTAIKHRLYHVCKNREKFLWYSVYSVSWYRL